MKRITEYIGSQKSGGAAAQKQLRQLVERYPYYQAARILLLRSLYESHDPFFGQELRRAAVFVPSRRVLYDLIEADRLRPVPESMIQHKSYDTEDASDRTNTLIEGFLNTLPEDGEPQKRRRRPTADASTDYISYMLQVEEDTASTVLEPRLDGPVAFSHGQQVLDSFLELGHVAIQDLPDDELQKPEIESEPNEKNQVITETLARIYIKQGKYDKALEIIQRLSLKFPKKNRYFADQIRFLRKLIVNNNNK